MVLAEFLAFEILTLAASWIGTTHLAAQSVVSTLTALTFQIPFPMSIAASTRIANLIGATLADAAKVAARVALIASVFVGVFNVILLSSLRNYIPQLFTNDKDVSDLVANILPICAAFQLFDALAANCNGILRGLGRQEIGGYVNLFAYYAVSNIHLSMFKISLADTSIDCDAHLLRHRLRSRLGAARSMARTGCCIVPGLHHRGLVYQEGGLECGGGRCQDEE